MARSNALTKAPLQLLASAAFLLCCSSCYFFRPQRGVEISTRHFDMDTVWLDNPIRKYNVEIVNTGRESLTISEIRPDCDCTTVSYPKKPIPSGNKGIMTITVDLHGFLPDSVHKKIGIYTNATDTPLAITLDGVAWRHI